MTSLNQSALITIGIDPHPGSHTACALDSSSGTLATLTVQNVPEGLGQLMAWCHCFPNRRFAMEGLGNSYIYPLVLDLLRQGEPVYSIPPAMTAQSRRGRKKNDVVDAENVARSLLANPDLPAYEAAPQQRALQELSRSYRRLSSELKANKMSLEVIVTPEVRQALQAVTATLQSALRQLLRVMEAQVKQLAPGLLRLTGVGPVVATTVLAEVGMLSRFSS